MFPDYLCYIQVVLIVGQNILLVDKTYLPTLPL